MNSPKLDNLVRIGELKKEAPRADELNGLLRSGRSRLTDAQRTDLSFDSRFGLAYGAAHALALYALRRAGYRSQNRYLVFQLLPETSGLQAGHWRVLADAHRRRNVAEYEGYLEADEQFLADLLRAAQILAKELDGGR